jgi:preprotein translocase subunit YajC
MAAGAAEIVVKNAGNLAPATWHDLYDKECLMFITPAFAQTGGGNLGFLGGVMPFVLIFVIIYLLIIRPQQRRMKEHKEMVAGIKRGDTIVTTGGLIGKVARVMDDKDEVQVELTKDVKVSIVRSMVHDVRIKGAPVAKK